MNHDKHNNGHARIICPDLRSAFLLPSGNTAKKNAISVSGKEEKIRQNVEYESM